MDPPHSFKQCSIHTIHLDLAFVNQKSADVGLMRWVAPDRILVQLYPSNGDEKRTPIGDSPPVLELWACNLVQKVAEGSYGGKGRSVWGIWVRDVQRICHKWRNPMSLARCRNLGELHKDMRGGHNRGSSNKALAFWYDVFMGYESIKHQAEGGCPPPYLLPNTLPPPTPCSQSYLNVFNLIYLLFILYCCWLLPTAQHSVAYTQYTQIQVLPFRKVQMLG